MKDIILKYLTGDSLTDQELEQLLLWVQQPKNLKEFKRLVKENYDVNMVYDNIDEQRALQQVRDAIRFKEKSVKRPYWKYAAAASVAIMISAGLWFFQKEKTVEPQFTEPIIVNNQIQTGTNKATLTLESGEKVELEKGSTIQTANATSNGEEIVYKTSNQKPATKNHIAFNTLTIPRGGQFYMVLADDTKVWLNSESQIKYPVTFAKGETRQVEIMYGEAYFHVSPSTMNNGTDFKVYHKQQEVRVLGTQFNIEAYKGEDNIYTTLVEGKVAINTVNESKILKPNQQSNLNIQKNSMTVTIIDDVSKVIAWRDGVFSFKGKPLKDIMKVLSRWYDMEVVFENKDLEDVRFRGVFNKSISIEEILSTIKSTNFINNYEIKDKTIILK